ncbi:MAG: DNA primase [Gammaproteobacteria bacterium]
MTADNLIARLERVRQTAPGRWLARCPAHSDRGPSLSVREVPDGRTLVHCFAGCDPESVLEAVGLRMADLFPAGARTHHAPPTRSRIPAADLLRVIERDSLTVGIGGARFLERRELTDAEWQVLAWAVGRIAAAANHLQEMRR